MAQSLSLGRVFFRDTEEVTGDKRLFIIVGKLWVPADTAIKSEHIYTIIGNELAVEGQGAIQFQMLLNGALNITDAAKKKDPNRILPLIVSPY